MKQNPLVDAFLNPEFYNHPVEDIKLIETHISWVFLTGNYAYKIKKPVDFGFLDFTTLEKRHFYCQQELRLNRRFAPQIYLQVLNVTRNERGIQLSGQGEIIDYAIKMKQFDSEALLSRLLQHHQVSLQHIEELSEQVAQFHQQIERADPQLEFGSPAEVMKPNEENFIILQQLCGQQHEELAYLHQQMHKMYDNVYEQLLERKQQGYIRECHGDLHLQNIALVDNDILLFDGIEFNDSFRWIDTMSDCAFLIMDLQDHGHEVFASHFLNHYLSRTGDYKGLRVLKFYKFYRAMVRAKVAALNRQQQEKASLDYEKFNSELDTYLKLARQYLQPAHPFLAITHGLSGSGKSWLSAKLSDHLGAIWLRSDIERKRLFGQQQENLYTSDATEQTYACLLEMSEILLQAGYPVIVDATFLDKHRRQSFQCMAENNHVPFHILSCQAHEKVLKQRLEEREQKKNEPSDADVQVMMQQAHKREQLEMDEQPWEIIINTDKKLNYKEIIKMLLYN